MTLEEFIPIAIPKSSKAKQEMTIKKLYELGFENVGEVRYHLNQQGTLGLSVMVEDSMMRLLRDVNLLHQPNLNDLFTSAIGTMQLLKQSWQNGSIQGSVPVAVTPQNSNNTISTLPQSSTLLYNSSPYATLAQERASTTTTTILNATSSRPEFISLPASSKTLDKQEQVEEMEIEAFMDSSNTSYLVKSALSGDIYKRNDHGTMIRISSGEIHKTNMLTEETTVMPCVVKAIGHQAHEFSTELQKLNRVISRGQSFISKSRTEIVTMFGYKHTESVDYIVMEKMRCSLGQLIHQEKDILTFLQRLEICVKCFNAVLCLQDDGIAHRDIKPANFLVNSDCSRVCLSDFGTIRIGSTADQTIPSMGTLYYAAPELFDHKNQDRFSDRSAMISDVYSLGVLLGEVIWQCLPFSHIVKPDVTTDVPFDFELYSSWTDPNLLQLVKLMTNKNPLLRPSVSKCKHSLEEILREQCLQAPVFNKNQLYKYSGFHMANVKKYHSLNKILFDFDKQYISSRVWLRVKVRYRLMMLCLKCIMYLHQHNYTADDLKLSNFYANHQLTQVHFFGIMAPLTDEHASEKKSSTLYLLGTILAEIWFHAEPSFVDVLPFTNETLETTMKEYQSFFKACWAKGYSTCEQLVKQLAACPVNYPKEYNLRLSSLVTLEGPIIVGDKFFAESFIQYTALEMKHLAWILRWNFSLWRNLMHLWNTPERQDIVYHIICHCENGAAMYFLAQHYEHGLAPFPKNERRMMNLLCRGWVIKYDACVRKFEKLIQHASCASYLQEKYQYHINRQYSHPFSQLFLAVCMFHGKVVNRDVYKAVGIFSDLSAAGYVFAQYWIAYCLNHGIGIERDSEKAAQMSLVVVEEFASSYPTMAYHYLNGEGVSKDIAKARKYIEQAVRYNCDSAFITLGKWLEDEGKPKEAEILYKQADAQDHPEAASLLVQLCAKQARASDLAHWKTRMNEVLYGDVCKPTPKLKDVVHKTMAVKRALEDAHVEQPAKKQKLE